MFNIYYSTSQIVGCWLLGSAVFLLIFCSIIHLKYSKPKILIKEKTSIGFNPTRGYLSVLVSNEKMSGIWATVCNRQDIKCWIEVDFIVDDEIPTINNRAACFIAEEMILKPDSISQGIEFASKIPGENGFHLKEPTPETLIAVDECLVEILIKTGQDEIVKRATLAIFDNGNDINIEHLGE